MRATVANSCNSRERERERGILLEDSVSVASVVCDGKNINYLKSYI